MNGQVEAGSFTWVEETDGLVYTHERRKRKVRTKKKREYVGWGSKPLIEFLEAIGKDTSRQLSQYEVTEIISGYAKEMNLFHSKEKKPSQSAKTKKKKRILCDQKLFSLFGRKTISHIKIHDLLESHLAENNDESSDGSLFNSEDDENSSMTCENQKTTAFERKTHLKKNVAETPKSCFAAIVPSNIKLVYLKRSLVEDLLKDPETFETKVVGSFIRIKCDPNDYLQKNSHQLLQVIGIKKGSGMNDSGGEILLRVSGFVRDISIGMLSDDNFSEEECEDLHQSVKDGWIKRPMVVDLEQKARVLHEDMTKHWLPRELTLLQNLIDRANEKGWRKELFEYLDRREKLQNPDEQARLLSEIPQVIAEDLKPEPTPDIPEKEVENYSEVLLEIAGKQASSLSEVPAVANGLLPEATTVDISAHDVKQESNSPKSILAGASEVPLLNVARNGTVLYHQYRDTDSAEYWCDTPMQQHLEEQINFVSRDDGVSVTAGINEAKFSRGTPHMQVFSPPVIELSDDEEEEPEAELLESLWHYRDPQGDMQGPFSLSSLKRWSDARYFPPDFKVWMEGRSQNEAVLLLDILNKVFVMELSNKLTPGCCK